MPPPADTGHGSPPPELTHRVARLVRHEVGDLLQSVYFTTAVLLERLAAPCEQERRLLEDLKGRAELCKLELDAVVDLVSAAAQAPSAVQLGPLVGTAVAQARRRHPGLAVSFESAPDLVVRADSIHLGRAMTFLLQACCQAARQQVEVRLSREGNLVLCTLRRDGFPASAEQLAWLEQPFATTHNVSFGLGLALARRALEPSGGVAAVGNLDGGGIYVRLEFPVVSP